MLSSLRQNLHLKITHLYLDKCNLSMGNFQEQINNYFELLRVIAEFLRVSKSLKNLSLNSCQITDELMNAIGKGLLMNEKLEYLSLRQNSITEKGL
jgi:hypothetical protein